MKKAIYCGGIIALLTTAVLVRHPRRRAGHKQVPRSAAAGGISSTHRPGIVNRDYRARLDTGVLVQEVRSETPASRAASRKATS